MLAEVIISQPKGDTMKRKVAIVAAVIVIGYLGSLIFAWNWEAVYGRYIASKFFDNIIANNYEEAFDYIYYYDYLETHFKRTIAYDVAKEAWVARMRDLQNRGVAPVAFSDLTMKRDDGYGYGELTLSVAENGETNDYTMIVHFHDQLFRYGITRLEILDRPGEDKEWAAAMSGTILNE